MRPLLAASKVAPARLVNTDPLLKYQSPAPVRRTVPAFSRRPPIRVGLLLTPLTVSSPTLRKAFPAVEVTDPPCQSISPAGAQVSLAEMNRRLALSPFDRASLVDVQGGRLHYWDYRDLSAGIASGSFRTAGMVVMRMREHEGGHRTTEATQVRHDHSATGVPSIPSTSRIDKHPSPSRRS